MWASDMLPKKQGGVKPPSASGNVERAVLPRVVPIKPDQQGDGHSCARALL